VEVYVQSTNVLVPPVHVVFSCNRNIFCENVTGISNVESDVSLL
jgi:hypothetical protein